MNLTIETMDYHRNGVCGEGFYVVLFKDHDQKRNMIATVFSSTASNDDDGMTRCAVYDVAMLAEGNIRFAENSWRGDQYFGHLQPLMQAWWRDHQGYELGA